MIVFRKIALTLLGLLTLIGCKDEPGKSKTEENNFEKISTIKDSNQKEQQTNFHKTLALQNISFDLKTSG